MRAWVSKDIRALRGLTSRNFRMVVGSKPSVLLDTRSWLDAAGTRFSCSEYRFGNIYARQLGGGLAVFATQVELKANINGHALNGSVWVSDLWRKSGVRRKWRLVERHLSRLEEDLQTPAAVRSLQLWR